MRAIADIAEAAFTAGRERDVEGFVALVHPEATLTPFTALSTCRGPEGAREWLASIDARYEDWDGDHDELVT